MPENRAVLTDGRDRPFLLPENKKQNRWSIFPALFRLLSM